MSRDPNRAVNRDLNDDRPPFFNTWRQLYAAIVVYLLLLIALFYAFTRTYQFSS
jgi:hypothetical protein